jgi:3-oxoadipate enol-lactonase
MARFFSSAFCAACPQKVLAFAAMLAATNTIGYMACCAALREADLGPAAPAIRAPTLVIAGSLDEATPPAHAQELHAAILGSELVVLDGAAHLSNIERADAFSDSLMRFLMAPATSGPPQRGFRP